MCAFAVVEVAFASAVITGDFEDVEAEFHVGQVVVALSVTLMVCGFGIGPLFWSPMVRPPVSYVLPDFNDICRVKCLDDEHYGYFHLLFTSVSTIFLLCASTSFSDGLSPSVFIIPCAVAKNIQTLLICRFFAGIFASAPLTLAGGTISDIWDNEERGFAIALFAAAPYGGPVLGPIVGGFVGETVGWRWIFWVQMIFAGVMAIFKCTIPETYPPVILKRRAAKLRKETGDPNIATEQELFKVPLTQLLVETLVRPFVMLFTEPILLLLSLYIALIYGLLVSRYCFFLQRDKGSDQLLCP